MVTEGCGGKKGVFGPAPSPTCVCTRGEGVKQGTERRAIGKKGFSTEGRRAARRRPRGQMLGLLRPGERDGSFLQGRGRARTPLSTVDAGSLDLGFLSWDAARCACRWSPAWHHGPVETGAWGTGAEQTNKKPRERRRTKPRAARSSAGLRFGLPLRSVVHWRQELRFRFFKIFLTRMFSSFSTLFGKIFVLSSLTCHDTVAEN